MPNRKLAALGLIAVCLFAEISYAVTKPISINVDSLPVTLDPPKLTDTFANWIILYAGDRLLEEHEKGDFAAGVAKRWKINSNFTEFEFEIETGRKFQNGEPISAVDVKKCIDETREAGRSGRIGLYLREIKSVRVVGSNNVVITLKRPLPQFLHVIADPMMTITKSVHGKKIFSGRFEIVGTNLASVQLQRRSDGQLFDLREMSFTKATDDFRAGKIQVIQGYALGQSKEISTMANRTLKLEYGKSYFLAFNMASDRFRKKEDREVFLKSLRRTETEEYLLSKDLRFSDSLFPRGLTMGRPEFASRLPIPLQPGNSASKPTRVLTQKSHELKPFLQALTGGKSIAQLDLDKAAWLKTLQDGDYDAALMGFGLTIRDWDAIAVWFESGAHFNFAKLADKKVDQILNNARSEIDPVKRVSLYRELLAMNDANVWYVPLANVPLAMGFSDDVELKGGSEHVVFSPFVDLNSIYWKENGAGGKAQ